MTNGYNLKQIRQRKGLSQMDVANKLGTTQPQYNKYETGKQDPTGRVIIALAEIYGLTPNDILGFDVTSMKRTGGV